MTVPLDNPLVENPLVGCEKPQHSCSCLDIDGDIIHGLSDKPFKRVPCKVLYDEAGSVLFEKITNLEEYYPYRAEREILEKYGRSIVDSLPADVVLVELGPGDCSKTTLLLSHMIATHGAERVRYIGVDVSGEALRQAKESLRLHCGSIPEDNITMIVDEYLSGLKRAQECVGDTPLCVLWLGSSVGNYTREESVDIFTSMRGVLNEDAVVLLGTDLWKDQQVLMDAYNDSQGVTRDFIINGMMNVLKICNHPLQDEAPETLWTYDPRIHCDLTQVEMWVVAMQDIHQIVPGIDVNKGERLLVEISRKFTMDDIAALACLSNFVVHSTWKSSQFSVQLLGSSRRAFELCWNDSDALFDHIEDWACQPIDLRHPFVFYYGHVASFTKIKLDTENISDMDVILSRGMDPHVDNPEVCHDHPAVPDSWPCKAEMIRYVRDTRDSILKNMLNDSSKDMKLVHLCLEHERMHQETLCYMLAQTQKAMPSSLRARNPVRRSGFYFEHASYGDSMYINQCTDSIRVPKKVISLGADGSKVSDFRWDNEFGEYEPQEVQSFTVASTPVTVREYLTFIKDGGYDNRDLWNEDDFEFYRKNNIKMPATWSRLGDAWMIHMPEKSYTLDQVCNQPVYVSLVEALAYATWKKRLIMTEAQYEAALGEFDRLGNQSLTHGGWEWTNSVFMPLKGFKPMHAYPEYSTDFFDGIHFTLKGSSPYTHPSMVRDSFRNFYQKNYRYVFAKFRLVD